jgi:NAD(P)-dependent dehydrogenase (short-subunit alcohol dehydrogenase family)
LNLAEVRADNATWAGSRLSPEQAKAPASATVAHGAEHFGSLDAVVNHAGFGHLGMVEDVSGQEIRAQLETNLLGAPWAAPGRFGPTP